MVGSSEAAQAAAESRPLQIEANGINVITDEQRKGHPRDLFWPWFAANVSVLGLSYGAFVLGFGVSFWQAVVAGLAGIIISFLLCGFIAVAGKRGSVPTMILGRAAFGVRGNKLPSAISWLLTVGWETVLMILATLATATVFERLGWGGGTAHGDHRADRGHRADDRRRGDRLRPDHADADGDHHRHRGAHGRLHHPVRGQDPLVRGVGHQGGLGAAVHRRAGVRDDRLRAGLGERRRGLLPLPAAPVLEPRRDRLDHVRLLAGPGHPAAVRAAAGRLVGQAERRDRRRPGRRAGRPAAHLVSGPVRASSRCSA